jgi:hypothetical protein
MLQQAVQTLYLAHMELPQLAVVKVLGITQVELLEVRVVVVL